MNNDNIEAETPGDNLARKRCSYDPTVKCKCRTKCMVNPDDLNEGAFILKMRMEYLKMPFGSFRQAKTVMDLRKCLLDRFEDKFNEQGWAVPGWIAFHRERNDDRIHLLFRCRSCGMEYASYTDIVKHAITCG